MSKRQFTLRDLIIVVAVITIGVILLKRIFFPSPPMPRRSSCASNFRQIFNGLYVYANENDRLFPIVTPGTGGILGEDRTVNNLRPGAKESPFTDLSPTDGRSVSQNLWVLVYYDYATPEVFLCPSSDRKPKGVDLTDGPGEGPEYFVDFPWKPKGQTISFSFIQPWSWMNDEEMLRRTWSQGAEARLALGADANNADRPNYKGSTARLTYEELTRYVNSRNHKGEGQNVLYGDGHVQFERSAYVGIDNDNIYTALPEDYEGKAGSTPGVLSVRPGSKLDTVLIPNDDAKLNDWNRTP